MEFGKKGDPKSKQNSGEEEVTKTSYKVTKHGKKWSKNAANLLEENVYLPPKAQNHCQKLRISFAIL